MGCALLTMGTTQTLLKHFSKIIEISENQLFFNTLWKHSLKRKSSITPCKRLTRRELNNCFHLACLFLHFFFERFKVSMTQLEALTQKHIYHNDPPDFLEIYTLFLLIWQYFAIFVLLSDWANIRVLYKEVNNYFQ